MEAVFIIAFREGLEVFLVIGIVLAFLKKSHLERIARYVWSAVFLGIVTATVLAFVLRVVIDGFFSEDLQYNLSLVVLFIAIILLSYMVFWMKNNSDTASMHKKIALSSNQKLITFFIVFTATLREALESVLFIFALTMENQIESKEIFSGLVLGLGGSSLLVYLLFKRSLKLPLKTFFRYTSYFLIFIVAGLVSLFIKGLQAYEYLPTLYAPVYDSSFLLPNDSIYAKTLSTLAGYDATPSLLQLMGWCLYIFTLFLLLRKKNV